MAAPAPSPTPAAPAPAAGPTAADQNDMALYDFLMADVQRMKRFASREVVDRLELHAQALQQIRGGLAKPGVATPGATTPAAAAPTAPLRQCGATVDLTGAMTETDKISLVIANAFACGRARIGVVRIGAEDPYHNYSHWKDNPTYPDKLRQMDKDWAGSFANLLRFLDSFPEGTGTLLDNTIVVWGSECCGEFGVGMNTAPPLPGEQDAANGIHNTAYMPFILAGSGGGKIRTGQRIVDMGRTSVDLYRTIALQLGVDASTFGDPAFFKGLLTDILV
jgi:hypothetical protein